MDTVAPGVTQLRIQRFVNVYFVETGTPGEWVLIDTGLPGSAKTIIAAAGKLFGPGSKPEAILLTHGHLDHLGSARELADHWHVPVIAHPLEMPYLTGQAQYPPRDPTVGGSLAFMSRFFPAQLPNLGERVQALNTDEPAVPYLMSWRWLHVPGHGPVIKGPAAAAGLHALAANYPVPAYGRYVQEPARTDASGVEHLPPVPKDKLPLQAAVLGAGILAAGAAWLLTGGRRRGRKPPQPHRSEKL